MTLDDGRPDEEQEGPWDALDAAWASYLELHPNPPGGSLLAQTLATGTARRSLLPLVPLLDGWDVLDIGTGFGPFALELARTAPVQVVGVDIDRAVLEVASDIAGGLGAWLGGRSSVRFDEASAGELPYGPATFDLATARLVFQHLPDPALVVGELVRVLRPGGYVFVFDVDDGLGVSYPPDEGPGATLEAAYAAWQASYGGDRQVGRKLSTMLAAGGLSIEAVTVVPQAAHSLSRPGDEARAVTAARLRAGRAGILAAGLASEEVFDRSLEELESSGPIEQFRVECQIAVVARRPREPDRGS